MRKFYIEADGVRIPLNGENGIWFTNPEGLGVTNNNSCANLRKGFFLPKTSDEFPQNSVAGDLVFVRNAYEKYRQFVNSLLMAGELILVYMPESTEYKRKVQINFINKSELKNVRWLTSSCAFSCLTPWYTTETMSGTSLTITARGQLDSTLLITCTETTDAESLNIESENSGTLSITRQMTAGETIEYSSMNTDSHIYVNGTDVFRYVNILNGNPYIRIKAGTSDVISCRLAMNATVHHYWRTI